MSEYFKILLVEDDHNFGSVLKAYLEMNDYKVEWITDGRFAVKAFNEGNFDICVLDVMLPNEDGFTIAGNIRKLDPEVPFIFLTAKTLKEDVLRGYSLGADDYITKPFDSEVLIMKICAILNRSGKHRETDETADNYTIGKYLFNHPFRTLEINDKSRKLSPREADLLKMLCEHKNDILQRDLALKSIWGEYSYFTTRSMDVFITKLRKYLKYDPTIEIVNIHGNGYRLIDPEAGTSGEKT